MGWSEESLLLSSCEARGGRGCPFPQMTPSRLSWGAVGVLLPQAVPGPGRQRECMTTDTLLHRPGVLSPVPDHQECPSLSGGEIPVQTFIPEFQGRNGGPRGPSHRGTKQLQVRLGTDGGSCREAGVEAALSAAVISQVHPANLTHFVDTRLRSSSRVHSTARQTSPHPDGWDRCRHAPATPKPQHVPSAPVPQGRRPVL